MQENTEQIQDPFSVFAAIQRPAIAEFCFDYSSGRIRVTDYSDVLRCAVPLLQFNHKFRKALAKLFFHDHISLLGSI